MFLPQEAIDTTLGNFAGYAHMNSGTKAHALASTNSC
jgi:hypothetical protein